MRQINLLPSEIAARRRARQITVLLAAGGLALVAVLAIVFIVESARLSGEKSKLEQARAANARLEGRVAQLGQFSQQQTTLRNKQRLLSTLTTNEVRWSVVLADVSLVIPTDVWLTNLSGSVQAQLGAPAAAGSSLGTIQMSGNTFTHLDVAKWLTRIAGVDGFAFPYLSLSTKAVLEGQEVVEFSSSVQLSDKAFRRNQPGGAREP
jgi:Tfp pilus assembly protein PilN